MRISRQFRVCSLLACIVLFSTSEVSSRPLEGGVQIDSPGMSSEPEVKEQTARFDKTLDGNASVTDQPPTWIQGKVFSNNEMYMYSFWQFFPFKKEFRWEIPKNRSTTVRMRPSVVKFWKGFKPDGICPVVCVPLGEGRFKFHSERPDGPHGYLERVGTNARGFTRYRFWFDADTDSNH